MTDGSKDSTRTMRDSFGVWNVDRVEREVVLRSSDDQYVAVPIPEGETELVERLEGSSGTVEATLLWTEHGSTSWQVEKIHEIDEET